MNAGLPEFVAKQNALTAAQRILRAVKSQSPKPEAQVEISAVCRRLEAIEDDLERYHALLRRGGEQ